LLKKRDHKHKWSRFDFLTGNVIYLTIFQAAQAGAGFSSLEAMGL
jgi:hypothetical protein